MKSPVTPGERPGGQILLWELRGDGSVGEDAPGMMVAPLSLKGQRTPGTPSPKGRRAPTGVWLRLTQRTEFFPLDFPESSQFL